MREYQGGEGKPAVGPEQTKAVLLVHEKTKANSDAVERIISEYRERFGKPQVMHTTQPLEVEFFGD